MSGQRKGGAGGGTVYIPDECPRGVECAHGEDPPHIWTGPKRPLALRIIPSARPGPRQHPSGRWCVCSVCLLPVCVTVRLSVQAAALWRYRKGGVGERKRKE